MPSELRIRIWAALGQLGPEHREIVVLRDYQDLTYDEIAATLGIPKGTVMSRIYYGRETLKRKLEAFFGPRAEAIRAARAQGAVG